MQVSDAKWICGQIGAREHYAVPRALHRYGMLDLFVTDAWIAPGSALASMMPALQGRFHMDLAGANVYAPNLQCISFELRAKFAGLHGWRQFIARNHWFQRVAAARLSQVRSGDQRTVMAYSYAALELFRLARARGWRTVLAQIDPGPVEERLVARLYDDSPSYTEQFERAPDSYWSDWREECELADRIVVNSSWSRSALMQEGVAKAKLCVIPLAYEAAPDASAFQRSYPAVFTAARPMRVLFLGQVNLRKGIVPLLDAMRLLRDEPIELWIVGSVQIANAPELRESPQVKWIGAVPRHETARYYREADLFILPTFSDGFALTQLEAQAWKLPTIATKYCGDVVRDGRNGWLLPEINGSAIAATLKQCLLEPHRLRQVSDWCGRSEKFDLTNVGQQWLQVFR